MARSLFERATTPGPGGGEKLSVHALVGVAQEILEGRMPGNAMAGWLDTGEQEDAAQLIDKVRQGEWTLDAVERVLILGEMGIYTPDQVQNILLPPSGPSAI